MQNSIERNIDFLDSVREDAEKILATEFSTNEYIAHLKSIIASADTSERRRAISDYGVSKISEIKDGKLASYFFVISNVKAFPPEARDFFVDVMLYCEDDIGSLKSANSVRTTYEKEIRPIL